MSELRLALIILGAVFLAAVVFWGRRTTRPKNSVASPELSPSTPKASRSRRVEPGIEDFSPAEKSSPTSLDMPTMHAVEPVRVEVMREVAVDIPGQLAEKVAAEPSPPAIHWPPPHTERVLTMRVVRGDGQAIAGRTLRQALEAAGMVHGPQRIYHLVDAQGRVLASAANLLRPGNLDPEHMDAQEFRGLSLFCVLPGPVSALQMLENLLHLAHSIADRAGAEVQNEQGLAVEGEILSQLRQSLLPKGAGFSPA
jgi:FtsZ-interacting cell division protein ZipA